ncbi:MAG TPA: hypothetical protein VHD90_20180 [Phototrophicaceae bacterium]|nr:hypothetical protein [Phototrophicaceae bacterium]
MVRLFVGQLPVWARREHPVLRHELGTTMRSRWQVRYARAFGVVVFGGVLLLIGYLIATGLLRRPAGQTLAESVNAILFWPLLMLQVILSIAALTSTSSFVADEMRRQNWDNLRATEQGAEMSMRARWVAVFYRLRGLLAVVLIARVILIGLMLYELTSFSGRYLDLLINGIVPDVPLFAAVLLVSFTMTAALLLPLTTVGFDAAVGLLISSLVQQRTYSTLLQGLLIFVRIVLTAALVFGATLFLQGQLLQSSDVGAWLLMAFYGAIGDWGLAFLHLGRNSEIWATIPYGIFLGLAFLIFALVQAAVADRLLIFAVRQAQKKG